MKASELKDDEPVVVAMARTEQTTPVSLAWIGSGSRSGRSRKWICPIG